MTKKTIRTAFMGTPDFAIPALQAMIDAPFIDMVAVYTRAPKPAGRGYKEQKSPVHRLAEKHGIPVYTPKGFRKDIAAAEHFGSLDLDVAVVAAYGVILPESILDAPKHGCINIHGSLLPRWRGAAPIHRAIEAGDTETGITIMQMDAGLDTGDMIVKGTLPITHETTTGDLHDAMAAQGGELLIPVLKELHDNGTVKRTPQPQDGVTYADKVTKAECRIDWNKPAQEILRKIHAFNPFPGAFSELSGERIKLLNAVKTQGSGKPGEVLDDDLTVACGTGALRITRLQRAGKKPMTAEEVLRGYKIEAGSVFTSV
jgi:methionyl-tRNA formyltransferase